MTIPPRYPRIPYLWEPDAVTSGDRVVTAAERGEWLRRRVVVEEKLDGANVTVWWEGSGPKVASRGGADAMDRAGQLGPLRAWAGRRYGELAVLLGSGRVLYAEWLWMTHTVHYDRLPDHLVALDLWRSDTGFCGPDERDEMCEEIGLAVPPRLFSGVLRVEDTVSALLGFSRFGTSEMEGVVLRRADGKACKVVAPGFVRADDTRIGRRHNAVLG